jgi:predicted outer membrane repeat protein
MRKLLQSLFFVLITLITNTTYAQIYVNHAATGANNGTSWANAYTDLKLAIDNTTSGEIWVAQGTYYPTSGSDRTISFALKNNVEIYGGFVGGETARTQRDYENNETIMSGDIGVASDTSDNTYSVIAVDGAAATITNSAILDGCTIRDGNANITGVAGGGIVLADDANPIIRNCKIKNNYAIFGGGIFCYFSKPILENIIFENNGATNGGGAIFFQLPLSTALTNCQFINNVTNNGSGGAIVATGSVGLPSIISMIDCIFKGNAANFPTPSGVTSGGAVVLSGQDFNAVNCTFEDNHANYSGGALWIGGASSVSLTACEFIDNDTQVLGGAIRLSGSATAIISHSRFEDNSTTLPSFGEGGAISNLGNLTIINSMFFQNQATGYGGAIYNSSIGNLNIYNTNLIANSLRFNSSSPTLDNLHSAAISNRGNIVMKNSISFSNLIIAGFTFTVSPDYGTVAASTHDITYCIGKNLPADPTNLDVDPLFLSNVTGRLQSTSPAIDAGDNTAIPTGVTTDFIGNDRIFGGTVDIGAYEFGACDYVANNRIYVDGNNSSGTEDGFSWATAFTDLQMALELSDVSCVQEIWVADGTYYPTLGTDRTVSFELQDDIKIYGGFAGSETTLAQRDLATNITILSGDIDHNTNPDVVTGSGSTLSITGNTGNSYHVIVTANLTNAALIDGITIKGGYGNSSSTYTYDDATITRNDGGGIYNHNSNLTISNVIFTGNEVTDDGGGIFNQGGNPTIVNCIFTSNYSASSGGGVYNTSASPTIINTTITGNYAVNGGGIRNWATSNPIISNSIIWNNANVEILNASSTPVLSHNIIEGSGGSSAWNSTFGTDNGNNLDSDPLFVDAANDDFSLNVASPAINTGNNAAIPSGITTDIIGTNRIVGTTVDMGAYENNFCDDITNNRIYVDANNSSGTENGLSWATAFTDLQTALEISDGFSCVQEIWVADGTYYPTSGTSRTLSFKLQNNLKIYGGFAGTETNLSQRNIQNIQSNPTILSGDIGTLTNNSDNSYHVVQSISNNNTAILDGFTIQFGNANLASNNNKYGGGFFGDNSDAIIRNCIIENNVATDGGGFYLTGSEANIINCIVRSNFVSSDGAGAYIRSNVSFTNCLFFNNVAANDGGGIYVVKTDAVITNTTFTKNNASEGGSIFADLLKDLTITNCIFWDNTNTASEEISPTSSVDITYSIIEGGYAGMGNLNQNPLFVNAAANDYATQSNSPATDAGNNAAIPAGIITDLAGFDRIIGGMVNIGAYETSSSVLPVELLYFKGEVVENGNLLTWETASEINNKGFEIQRSKDGRNWFEIGFVEGNGTTLENSTYEFLDDLKNGTGLQDLSGLYYYRLKQMDFNDDFEYSNIVTLTSQFIDYQVITLFPNPVQNELTIANGEGNAIIYNSLGQPVKQFAVGSSQMTIDISDLESGIYILKLQKTNGSLTSKQFVKL